MKKYYFLLYFFVLLFSTAQNTAAPLSPAPPGWQVKDLETFSPETLYLHIDGAAELFLEFGFRKMTAARLSQRGVQLSVEIYQMASPLSALGIFLDRCSPETPISWIIPRNSGDSCQLEVVKGSRFIVINPSGKHRNSLLLMRKLANELAMEIPDTKVKWPCSIPEKGLVRGSIRLARGALALRPALLFPKGGILQLNEKTWAIIADYRNHGQKETLIRIKYPDKKKSRAVFISLLKTPDTHLKIIQKNDTTFVFLNNNNVEHVVQRHGSILDIRKIYNTPSSESKKQAGKSKKRGHRHAD